MYIASYYIYVTNTMSTYRTLLIILAHMYMLIYSVLYCAFTLRNGSKISTRFSYVNKQYINFNLCIVMFVRLKVITTWNSTHYVLQSILLCLYWLNC